MPRLILISLFAALVGMYPGYLIGAGAEKGSCQERVNRLSDATLASTREMAKSSMDACGATITEIEQRNAKAMKALSCPDGKALVVDLDALK